MQLITNYKYNWDNEKYILNNHKIILDIKRTAKKNMIFYQKSINSIIEHTDFIILKNKVNSELDELIKKFKYYRLTLYSYTLASFTEVILSGNFKKEYLKGIIKELSDYSMDYRTLHTKCSSHLEKISHSSLETNVLKGVGDVANVIGGVLGNLPVFKENKVDKFLEDGSKVIKGGASDSEDKVVVTFAKINNPNTSVLIDNLKLISKICNTTGDIYFDKKNIYLLEG